MPKRSTRIALALASLLFAGTELARAQDRPRSESADPLVFGTGATYEVKFDDDPLAALPNGVIVPRIAVRGKLPHASLMRPRAQFVVEMLKSADTF
ncbi:MAG TPA: hypothetical protein VF103_13890 [Polyangiaceae bacterium]